MANLAIIKCDCRVKGPGHEGDHTLCCKCIRCETCGWIKSARWQDHLKFCPEINPRAEPIQTPVVVPAQTTAPTPTTPAVPSVLNSLEIGFDNAAAELGIDLREGLEPAFQAKARAALEDLLEHHQWIDGEYSAPRREDRWKYLLGIIFNPNLDDGAIVEKLLSLFPEEQQNDELVVKLWELIADREVVLPAKSQC